jgi:hypothetical protein
MDVKKQSIMELFLKACTCLYLHLRPLIISLHPSIKAGDYVLDLKNACGIAGVEITGADEGRKAVRQQIRTWCGIDVNGADRAIIS